MNIIEQIEQVFQDLVEDVKYHLPLFWAGVFFAAGVLAVYLAYKWIMVCP